MKPEVALYLIEGGISKSNEKQTWADLGAGNGLFTYALSSLLANGSTIYAVDMNRSSMNTVRVKEQVRLEKIHADFVTTTWITNPLNGIIMANALHFVKDKVPFLQKLKEKLVPGGRLIIVEYEMEIGNSWVPYPIAFNRLSELTHQCGFATIRKLREVPSVYDSRTIYSTVTE